MDIQEFIQNFADELDETSVEELSPETDFKTLKEWGSLTALSISAMIDEIYSKDITGADLRNCTTLQDLFNTVKNK